MKYVFKLLTAAGLAAASATLCSAQPYYLAGQFEGWCNNCNQMTDDGAVGVGGAEQYSYEITNQTPSSFDSVGMKVTDGTWNNTWPSVNMFMWYNTSGDATIYFTPGTFTDNYLPTANRVGYADPGLPWEVAGDFTSPNWASDPAAQLGLVPGSNGVYTNLYTIATPGTHNFKFRTAGTWSELQVGTDFSSDNTGNAVVITTSTNAKVLFILDLPNGRWQAGGPPATSQVQFSVDMTLVQQTDPGFNPTSVTVNGDAINAWGGTPCTNNPSAADPNIYYSPYFTLLVGANVQFQYRYLSSGNTEYDALGGISGDNRTLTVANVASTNLPTVYWDDALPTDLLNVDTTVTFTVNMTNAVGTDAVVFDPTADLLFVNGDWLGWPAWNPISLSSSELNNTPVGSDVWTFTTVFPQGHTRAVTYKYAINGADDEAGFAQNHFRYIRSTTGVYNFPMDTFGVQYNEPKVGGLAVGQPASGLVPVTWLAYPNVNVQTSTNLLQWQDVPNTTGASGINSSAAGGPKFFRLIQQSGTTTTTPAP